MTTTKPPKVSKSLDIAFARILLHRSKEELELEIVPLRWKTEHKHWGKGSLLGFTNKHLIVRPLTSTHGKTDQIDPLTAHLWTSKMPPEQVELVKRIQHEIANPPPPKPVEEPVIEPVAIVTVTPLDYNPAHFRDKFNAYLSIKKEVSEIASTEGLHYLSRLKTDYDEAMAMADQVKSEMMAVASELKHLGAQLPTYASIMLSKAQMPNHSFVEHNGNGHAKKAKLTQVLSVVPKKSNNWSMGLARKFEYDILNFLRSREHMVMGKEIISSLNIQCSTPSTVLAPLVAKGVIEQFGNRSGTRYRIAKMQPDEID